MIGPTPVPGDPLDGQERRTIEVVFDWDPTANAAAITFDAHLYGRATRTLPFFSREGSLMGTVNFAPDGRLACVELLDAERQVPDVLR